ncbi:MAG: amidohydrolase [Planctomycetales bacterium]|nr:amidohydrolase [Planctomycetales bacterium]
MWKFSAGLTLLAWCSALPAMGNEPKAWMVEHIDSLVELYQQFHAHPELSFEEEGTANRLAAELRSVGAEVTQNVGGHGIVAILRNGEGPTLMLRTDLDALPVVEQTGLPYASQVRVTDQRGATVGVMHACGHDVHMTNLVGVARYLSATKSAWRGTLMMIGQPAEERGEGAKAMLDDGLFRRFPKPDFAIALHVDAALETGKVGYRAGYSLANVDSVDIKIHGRGGHGAYPHTTIDPIVIAARLVLDLQTIVSREVKPIEPSVITVGAIHGGTKHNVIGDTCELQITVRSYSQEVRRQLHDAIRRKAKAATDSSGAPGPEVEISEGTPSLWNDPELGERVAQAFRAEIGDDNVTSAEPSMGGEDFSRYGLAGVPIMMYRLGSVNGDRLAKLSADGATPPSLHSPFYYPDAKPALMTGCRTMIAAALTVLQSQ